ncbi:hypothetical protein EC973_003994 [Apophysomyces ossiformis]|uniref:Uncharacterized protein n=1 Tax=Apophysomyces ossiformis TaxID=679940 RepID=A0A8H7BSN7_9FUNG|nr:hypothetical protein EC973_003994 [Apophysomyces ossiformis]
MDNATASHFMVPLGVVGPDLLEIFSEFVSLTCITVLAVALGIKTYGEQFKTINYGRALVIVLYFMSWAFSTTSAILVSTNNNNMTSCTLAMLTCDIFYCGSKIAIYAWLIERVHLVTAVKTTRLKTCQYRIHICMLFPYVIIFVLMLSFRNIYLEDDGKCTIGLQLIASVPLLVYDFIFNMYLTWLFMRPLMNVGRYTRGDWKRSRLYRLARRTFVASVVCLLISFVNVFVVVYTHGHERGLVCLTMCTVDVTVNVVTVHWVTTSKGNSGSGRNDDGNYKKTQGEVTAEMTFDDREPDTKTQYETKKGEDGESTRSFQLSNTSTKPLQY